MRCGTIRTHDGSEHGYYVSDSLERDFVLVESIGPQGFAELRPADARELAEVLLTFAERVENRHSRRVELEAVA